MPSNIAAALYWLWGLAGVVVSVNQVLKFWRTVTGGFQSAEAADSAGAGFRRRADCIEIHKTVTREFREIREKLDEKVTEMRCEFKTDLTAVNNQLTHITETVGSIRGLLEGGKNVRR